MSAVGVLDAQGLLELFSRVAGRKLLGVVDGIGVVELVFADDAEDPGKNLVSICCNHGRHTGLVLLGFVDDPARYVETNAWPEAA
jgi:hypothetical protein